MVIVNSIIVGVSIGRRAPFLCLSLGRCIGRMHRVLRHSGNCGHGWRRHIVVLLVAVVSRCGAFRCIIIIIILRCSCLRCSFHSLHILGTIALRQHRRMSSVAKRSFLVEQRDVLRAHPCVLGKARRFAEVEENDELGSGGVLAGWRSSPVVFVLRRSRKQIVVDDSRPWQRGFLGDSG